MYIYLYMYVYLQLTMLKEMSLVKKGKFVVN